MPPFRVAAFQRQPLFDDLQAAVAQLQGDLAWCDARGVALALFPECYLQGHASDRATIARRALSLGGKEMAAVLAALAPYRTRAIVGLVERRGAAFYNSAAVIDSGRVLGMYAKTHPNEAGFDAGDAYPVFDAGGWRFGINICNDANFREAALAVSGQGAQLLCYPLNNLLLPATAERWRGKSIDNLRDRARDTGCWVMSADVAGIHGDKISHGCTAIVSPDGEIVARVDEGECGVAVHDLC